MELLLLWKFKKSDDKFNCRIHEINHQVSNDILLDIGNMKSHFSHISMNEPKFSKFEVKA